MMQVHTFTRGTLAAGALAIAAVCAPVSAVHAASTLNMCALLTPADAQRALGGAVTRSRTFGQSCGYELTSNPDRTVLLTAMSPGPGYPYAGYLKMSEGAATGLGRHYTHVAGVGQQADYDGAEHLLFASHGWVLDVGIRGTALSGSAVLGRATEVARAVDRRVR